MLNAISVDVEEYFHAANLEPFIPPARWHSVPSRVEFSTQKVLDLFAESKVKGTFFVLGCVAKRHPALVKDIVAQGHELASHGYGHRLGYQQEPKAFFRDVERTKKLLEDISGQRVLGYRAPNFSITDKNAWAYDKLLEADYLYDSSLYPVWHPRYANVDKKTTPHLLKRDKGNLYVIPLAVGELNLFGRSLRLPVAGGAYWRLLPRLYTIWGLKRAESANWFTCYFHPWELDSEQPVVHELSRLTKLRHYGGIKRFDRKISYILSRFSFGPIKDAAEQTFGQDFAGKAAVSTHKKE